MTVSAASHKSTVAREEPYGTSVHFNGTVITPEDIRRCRDGLGAVDTVQAFWHERGRAGYQLAKAGSAAAEAGGYYAGVGKVLPGANIRICVPGTRDVVSRGEVGELHIGGPPVIGGYLGGVEPESLYTDHAGNWLVTGDQARMDGEGAVYILGRHKDLLAIGGAVAQVVGVPDPLAGQVPVAVVKRPDTATKGEVAAKCRALGPMYEDLVGERPGLDDSVATFADSITIFRFCGRVLTLLSQRLYLQGIVHHDTVTKQAALVEQRYKQQDTLGEEVAASFRFPRASTTSYRKGWPFVPRWIVEVLPPAKSIDGLTREWTLELCEVVRRGETVGGLLKRMAVEGGEVESHVQAPWGRVLEGLGGEAGTAVDAAKRQAFVGLIWNAFMVDQVNIFYTASWDTAR
ncbi:hypothetical protein B0H67DRAFT_648706 [Lasiosphaeris hirsuta]|uniref:AMP-dependent synthetase/ligase domain-containing protein n=1 Tax=Lasiosphaeris hirsuta TaxID=260670 RepID=A0AA40A3N1_9PEZI|nr:hypothetical protein B0H67DRAFT_648706 [Lasiosphaeris hirsuta]